MGKILIIEDDPLVARMYGKVMKFEGMEVESASDGKEGIEKAKKLKPNLIFCDIMMPKMNGIEVLEHLKADPETASIPVVMLTNLSGTHDAETALQKGAISYMVKSEYKPKDVANKAKEMITSGAPVQPAPVQAAPTPPPATATSPASQVVANQQAVVQQPAPQAPTPPQPTTPPQPQAAQPTPAPQQQPVANTSPPQTNQS